MAIKFVFAGEKTELQNASINAHNFAVFTLTAPSGLFKKKPFL